MTISIRNTLEPAIRNLVLAASGLDRVIFMYPNAPRPEMPYAAIQKIGTSKVINDWQRIDQTSGLMGLFGVRTMRYQVSIYGDGAVDIANTMQSQLKGCNYPSDITIYVQEHYRLFGIPHYFNNDM